MQVSCLGVSGAFKSFGGLLRFQKCTATSVCDLSYDMNNEA